MRSTRASWMKYANSQRERKFNLKIETWTNKKREHRESCRHSPSVFYLLTTFDVPLVALYTLCVSSPFAQDNEVDGRMKSRKMICRPSTYRQNLFGMGDGIISWRRTIFAPLPISSLFFVFPFLHAARPGGLKTKKKSTHATLHFPAGSFGLASRVPSIKHSSQYYSQSSSQSLCGVTVAIFQQPQGGGAPWKKKCVEIFHLRLFSKQKRDEPGLVSSSFWMSCTADVGGFLACKIYRTSGGWNTTKFKGGKEPEDTRVVLGWCPGFQ